MDPAALLHLRLSLVLGFSAKTAPALPHPFLDPSLPARDWLAMSEPELREAGLSRGLLSRLRRPPLEAEAVELEKLSSELGLGLLWRGHPDWPRALLEIPDPPFVLWYEGDLGLLRKGPALCLVGTRHPSPYGMHAARSFTEALALADLPVLSGLARGIDGLSHRGVLDAGGRTLAVLGSGLREVYPKEHQGLARRILAEGGLLLSEYPPRFSAHPGTFPRRNRLLAALSQGVLVIEATRRSGSLITAEFAASYGRPVWALPGPFGSHNSAGCHALIRDGALLADGPEGLLQDLGLSVEASEPGELIERSFEARILANLRGGPKPAEALATELRDELSRILLGLQRLEASGRVERRAGGLYFTLTERPESQLRRTTR